MDRVALEAEFRRTPGTGVLALGGELDIATAPALAEALTEAAESLPDGAVLVVDLDDVRFCGARGFSLLLDAADLLAARGGHLVLTRRPDLMRRLMDLVGIEHRPHPLVHPPDPAAVELIPRSDGPRYGEGRNPPTAREARPWRSTLPR